jgi:peptidoglycan/LPS O-acetylase OafA/YrhL
LRALVVAPIAGFAAALILAVFAGLFLGFFGSAFVDDPNDTSVIFDLLFVTAFVFPAYLVCGFVAAKLAETRPLFHATIAGILLLGVNFGSAFLFPDDDPFQWIHALCYILTVPLVLLGGKLARVG